MKHFNFLKQTMLSLVCLMGVSLQALALSGPYTIGPTGDYPDLAAAITDLNTNGVSGAVTFNIQPGTYSGSNWQGMITSYVGMGSNSPVVFQPADGNKGSVIISAAGNASANYVLAFNNASYVRVHKLTFINTNTTNATVISFMGASSFDSLSECTFNSPTVTSSASSRAVVAFGVASPYSGTNVSLRKDTVLNGSSSFFIGGDATNFATNVLLDNNHCTGPYTYGLYSSYAVNLAARSNRWTSSSTAFNTVFRTDYANGGLEISNNTAAITTTTPTVYGMYNNYVNSSNPGPANIIDNNISVTTTTGTNYTMYNNYCVGLSIQNNTISAIATGSGVTYAPTIAYGGSDLYLKGNIFNMQGTTGGINTTNYILVYNPTTAPSMNIIARENTFNYTQTSGQIGSTNSSAASACFMYYANNVTFNKNTYNVNTQGTVYSIAGGYYGLYYCKFVTVDSNNFNLNGTTGTYYFGLGYIYSTYNTSAGTNTDNSFSYNNFSTTITSGSLYVMGQYGAGYEFNFKMIGNKSIANATSGGAVNNPYMLAIYMYNSKLEKNTFTSSSTGTVQSPYALGYYAQPGTKINDNIFNITNSGSYYCYYYSMYGQGGEVANNTFNINTTGTCYAPYYFTYSRSGDSTHDNKINVAMTSGTAYVPYYLGYSVGGKQANNIFTVNATSSAYIYQQYLAYSSNNDTMENNTFNFSTVGGQVYCYGYYPQALIRNNTWNINNTTGSSYFGFGYPAQGLFHSNAINMTSTTGGIYGIYDYNPNGSGTSGLNASYNKWTLKSTSGPVYGYYNTQGDGGITFANNVVSTSTSGTSYLFYNSVGFTQDIAFYNNTFHSNSTNATNNYLLYSSGSSYPSKGIIYNNIFSRSNTASANPVYINDTAYYYGDYNLFYSPSAFNFQSAKPSYTGSSTNLQGWRSSQKRDMNSLIYDPGYTNPAGNDFSPSANNPNSWAVNGRGRHLPGDTLDITGATRPKTRQQGAIDIGAYEVNPTSTPPACTAIPASPVSGGTQYFLFGQDTAASVEWGSSVPASATMRQYAGQQAPAPMPALVGRGYTWLNMATSGGNLYAHKVNYYYKDPQLGDISNEKNTKFANYVAGSIWTGYNFGNSVIDSELNISSKATPLDTTGSYTIVENARIGIRCVVEPTGLNVSNITASDADVTWDPVFLPIGYQVITDKVPGTPTLGAGAQFTSTNSIHLSALDEATVYYVHVRTICGTKDTSGWTTIQFRTLVTCHAPEVKITAITQNRAIAYWDTVETATRYEYVIQTDETPVPAFGTNTTTNSVYLNIQPGKEYFVYVKAFCNSIYPESEWGMARFVKWPTGINTINGSSIGLVAYPNPVTNVLHVELGNKIDGEATLTVTDITGKQVRSLKVVSNITDISMQDLAPGVYQVRYSDRSHVDVMKITKE